MDAETEAARERWKDMLGPRERGRVHASERHERSVKVVLPVEGEELVTLAQVIGEWAREGFALDDASRGREGVKLVFVRPPSLP